MENFLTITADNAAIISDDNSSFVTDERYWKPNIKKTKTHEYQALVRVLPQGVNGLKNRIDPSAKILTHYLRDPETGIVRTIPCRKNLGAKEPCPICEAGWAMFNEGKKLGAVNGKKLMEAGKRILPKTNYLINILIRNDIQHPELNGQVKIWTHTPKMNRILFAPTKNEDDPNKQSIIKKELFYPYAPIGGRDFAVIVVENPENQMASYDNSQWADAPSNIAETEGEILGILDKCYDLVSIVKNIPTAEEIAASFNEFNAAVAQKRSSVSMMTSATDFSVPVSASAPALKPAVQGDAKTFFSGAALNTQPVQTQVKPAQTPIQTMMDSVLNTNPAPASVFNTSPKPSVEPITGKDEPIESDELLPIDDDSLPF